MGHLAEILASGRAPGFTNRGTVDQDSVYAKAPKGLRELESEPIYKHGPARGARRIAKYFGQSAESIKRVWARPPLAILFACITLVQAHAGDLQTGETFTDGQTVHASDLNQAINGATLQTPAITAKPLNPAPGYSDYILGYSPASGNLYKTTIQNFLANVQSITLLPSGYPIGTNQDLFSFYSAANTNLQNITFANLVEDISTNLSFSEVSLGSNGVYYLPSFPYSFSGNNTNNQPQILVTTTNGVPYIESLSNFESSIISDASSNLLFLPNIYNQVFQPWTIYGTNTVAPYTNAWGFTTNFPITALNMYGSATNTIGTNDALPVLSQAQGTNTTVTVGALVQYLTALNALPNYTQSRISFGIYSNARLGINIDNSSHTFQTDYTGFNPTNPTCVSFFLTNSSAFPGGAGLLLTNTPYWCLSTNGGPLTNSAYGQFTNAFLIYATYTNAIQRTNSLDPTSAATKTNWLSIVPVFTAFNADIINLASGSGSAGMASQAGQYAIYFRTPSTTTNYYISGSCQSQATGTQYQGLIAVDSSGNIFTNSVWIDTQRSDAANQFQNFPRSWVLISPQ